MFETWFWIWAGFAALLYVAEMFTAGFFMLPFALGATVAAGLQFLGIGFVWQFAGFLGVSVASFLLLRSFAEHITHEPPVKTGIDRLTGATGVVIDELIPNDFHGQVRIMREEWRADAPGYDTVAVGTRVIVVGVEGTHLIVRPDQTGPTDSPRTEVGA